MGFNMLFITCVLCLTIIIKLFMKKSIEYFHSYFGYEPRYYINRNVYPYTNFLWNNSTRFLPTYYFYDYNRYYPYYPYLY